MMMGELHPSIDPWIKDVQSKLGILAAEFSKQATLQIVCSSGEAGAIIADEIYKLQAQGISVQLVTHYTQENGNVLVITNNYAGCRSEV